MGEGKGTRVCIVCGNVYVPSTANQKCCSEKCQAKHRKEYMKEYYIENKERLSERHRQYDQDNREKRARYSKQYYEKNREKYLKYFKEYGERNKERLKEKREAEKRKLNDEIFDAYMLYLSTID